jgi:hypothetical protein
MVVDQILGRFSWYRRHRGGFWTRIPGSGGGYFRRSSDRSVGQEWSLALTALWNDYRPAWLERLARRRNQRVSD